MAIFLTVLIVIGVVAFIIGVSEFGKWCITGKHGWIGGVIIIIILLVLFGKFCVYPQVQSWLSKPAVVERMK